MVSNIIELLILASKLAIHITHQIEKYYLEKDYVCPTRIFFWSSSLIVGTHVF